MSEDTEETIAILKAGGASNVLVAPDAQGFLVTASFPLPNYEQWGGKRYQGHSGRREGGPQELAREFVADVERIKAGRPLPDALAPAPEAEETPAHEAHGETGESNEELPVAAISGSGENLHADDIANNAYATFSGDQVNDERPDNSDPPLDADFDPIDPDTLEDADLGAELLADENDPPMLTDAQARQLYRGNELDDPEPPSLQDRFIGLDDLDRRRSLRIGDVTTEAMLRMPLVDWPLLAELRNFAMGVSEGRWPNDEAKQSDLAALEGLASQRRHIEALRDERVTFLLNASREEVEAFDPKAGWPE